MESVKVGSLVRLKNIHITSSSEDARLSDEEVAVVRNLEFVLEGVVVPVVSIEHHRYDSDKIDLNVSLSECANVLDPLVKFNELNIADKAELLGVFFDIYSFRVMYDEFDLVDNMSVECATTFVPKYRF